MTDHLLVFVDDEPNILHSLVRIFMDDDYQIECFTSTSKAFDYVSSNPVSLVISDQRMPGESGSEFLIRVKQIRPETIRMILTGYSDLEAAMQAINEGGIYKILMKPWSDEDLRSTVQRSLEFYDLKMANQDLLTELLFKNSELDVLNKKLAEKINERTRILLGKNLEIERLSVESENRLQRIFTLLNLFYETTRGESFHTGVFYYKIGVKIQIHMGMTPQQKNRTLLSLLLAQIARFSEMQSPPVNFELLASKPVGQMIKDWFLFPDIAAVLAAVGENWDGTGHPAGLQSDQIPFESRYIRLVLETGNFLLNEDPSDDSLRTFLQMESGKLFDPEMCQAALTGLDYGGYHFFMNRKSIPIEQLRAGMELSSPLMVNKTRILFWPHTIIREEHLQILEHLQKDTQLPETVDIINQSPFD